MYRYSIEIDYTDSSSEQIETISLNMYDAYQEAMEIALRTKKGINNMEIKKKPG